MVDNLNPFRIGINGLGNWFEYRLNHNGKLQEIKFFNMSKYLIFLNTSPYWKNFWNTVWLIENVQKILCFIRVAISSEILYFSVQSIFIINFWSGWEWRWTKIESFFLKTFKTVAFLFFKHINFMLAHLWSAIYSLFTV